MSISLKALYDQVQGLSSSGIKSVNKSDKGYMEFNNGIILNWGSTGFNFSGNIYYAKPFTTKCFAVTTGYGHYTNANIVCNTISEVNKDYFTHPGRHSQTRSWWIAIGYLVSNRVKGWVM